MFTSRWPGVAGILSRDDPSPLADALQLMRGRLGETPYDSRLRC